VAVYPGSRYEGVAVTQIIRADGTTATYLHSRKITEEEDARPDIVEHRVQEGESLGLLAFIYGGREQDYWLIADINNILDPNASLIVGSVLKVPRGLLLARGQ